MLHVCLAGPGLVSDRPLLDALRRRYSVTLLDDHSIMSSGSALDTADVLVLDAARIQRALGPLLAALFTRRPELRVVLVDGGLSEHDKVDAFRLGVLDYFAAPCNAELLSERVAALARSSISSANT